MPTRSSNASAAAFISDISLCLSARFAFLAASSIFFFCSLSAVSYTHLGVWALPGSVGAEFGPYPLQPGRNPWNRPGTGGKIRGAGFSRSEQREVEYALENSAAGLSLLFAGPAQSGVDVYKRQLHG